jgi:hypothetical protein
MESELNYLSDKISVLETEIYYYERESIKTESEQKRNDLNNIIEIKEAELDVIKNILTVITNHSLSF